MSEKQRALRAGVADYHGDAGPGIQFLTRLTLLREVNWDTKTQNLVANPVPELLGLRTGSLASEHIPSLPATPHVVAKTGGGAAASADIVIKFSGFTAATKGSFGACVLGNGTSGSGIGITITLAPGQNNPGAVQGVNVASGACKVGQAAADIDADHAAGSKTMQLFDDETELTVRVLPDRSVADWFVQGGRWAASDGWPKTDARNPEDSNVIVWATTPGVAAKVEVHGMGCGWLDPSYTEHPTI